MSDERLIKHIGAWMKDLAHLPAEVELRSKDEIIDTVHVAEDSDYEVLATDLIESASADAQDEGKTRTYTVVAINRLDERIICPLRVRRRVDRSSVDMLAALAKQNAELHECLRKKDQEAHAMLLRYAEAVGHQYSRIVDENDHHRQRSSEVIDKLETLRSKQLERDLEVERHKSQLETRERLTDAAIPLMMAIGGRFTKGALPSPDLKSVTFVEIVKSLNEEQLDAIRGILAEQWPLFAEQFEAALSGHPDVNKFKHLAGALTRDQLMGLVQVLNIGQQSAIQELLNDSN